MPADLVLIDTSVWVEYFRKKDFKPSELVDHLIESDRVGTLDIIQAELLRGARSDKEIRFLQNYFGGFHSLEIPDTFWIQVGEFSYKVSQKGYLPHLVDAYIALAAIENGASLFSIDKDFHRIASLSPLIVFKG